MKKRDTIAHWSSLPENQTIAIEPIPYKHRGSTYDECGIRICGSREFIDSVLSHLKGLLEHENGSTRLQVVYQQSTDRVTGRVLDSWNCYLQVHQRGPQAQFYGAMFGSRRTSGQAATLFAG